MLSSFMLALVSQLSAPVPIGADTWFSPDDFPTEMMEGTETTFQPVTQTLVDASGKIIGCRVETPSSSAKMDALACALIIKRGHFAPARWTDGTPVPGVYRWPFTFTVFGDSYERYSDVELEVARLPNDKKSAFVTVDFASDAEGKVGECVAARPTRHSKPDEPALVSVACSTVQVSWKPFTVLGSDGKPSRSVQNAVVKFTSQTKP